MATTWERVSEPPNVYVCRRCQLGYSADENVKPDEREHWRASSSDTVHIKRVNLTPGMRPYTRAAMALQDGKPVTYCGREIVAA